MRRAAQATALALAANIVAAGAASAGFDGDLVFAGYVYGGPGDILLSGGTAVVGPGVEFPTFGGVPLSVDASDSQVTFTYSTGVEFAPPVAFDGFVLANLTEARISGVSLVATNIAELDGSFLSFDSSHVYVNAGLVSAATLPAGSFVTVDVSFTPEPSAWALMILGFGGVGAALRRRVRVTPA